MIETDSNVLLVLMRLDVNQQYPLRGSEIDSTGHWKRLQEDEEEEQYLLLAGVLDPSERAAAAPVTPIPLTGTKLKTYNEILRHVEDLSDRYYREGGYIERPETFTPREQAAVSSDIRDVGRHIYDLFHAVRSPVRRWLDRLLETAATDQRGRGRVEKRPLRPVTIVTNDFSIPWYWLKRETFGPSLCEVCSLGTLQLQAAIGEMYDGSEETQKLKQAKTYRALLLNGSSELPFSDREVDAMEGYLQSPSRAVHTFEVERAYSAHDLIDLDKKHGPDPKIAAEFRIVHFSGHYSSSDILIGDDPLREKYLHSFIKDSLLVLDGCSSARGLKAWADIEGLTSELINKGGALGCVATVLPVKHDPIVSRVLWREFYSHLRSRSCSVGYALAQARLALKRHFDETASPNPIWLLYQLIGSSAVRLVEEEEPDD